MFLDLDRFKMINDSLGHVVGNQLLQRVAERLQLALRESDTVARMGGDEFMVLLPSVDGEDDCAVVAEKVLSAFGEPFAVEAPEFGIGASIECAIYPEHGEDADTLTRSANLAMYQPRPASRNAFAFYTSDMSARAHVKHSLGTSLRSAWRTTGSKSSTNQKSAPTRTRSSDWKRSRAGRTHSWAFVPPNAFIPIAEETGLINVLGEWVLDRDLLSDTGAAHEPARGSDCRQRLGA